VFRTIALSLGLVVTASAAFADCSPFPRSNFIGSFSHDQVIQYVDRAHGGDWTPYLSALDNNLARLNKLRAQGRGAVVKVRGEEVQLSAFDLSKFVFTSQQFSSVAHCLAERQEMAALSQFETAAGENAQSAAPTQKKVVQSTYSEGRSAPQSAGLSTSISNVKSESLNVRVSSQCNNGDTVFVVANTGNKWPRAATFSLFRISGPNRQMISARKMSIEPGAAKTLRVKKSHNPTGHIGLSLDPGWYKRDFTMDARAECK
jgi:hypothetical protein